ncbi:MAG: DUF488 domain-containing protein [Gammaproteobacteria bacterium]|nr:DUF488 domain-containing protein [Gammaproteobacteria bacterium]
MKQLFTIGYEGTMLDAFLATLDKARIDVLLDIREFPVSRRKGFSKNVLYEALTKIDIDYRHERQLGSPRNIRHKLREDGNYKIFFREFDRHLKKQTDLLLQLTEELRGNVALMCYEKDHTHCHRSPVGNALAEIVGLTPKHLEVNNGEQRKAGQTPYTDPSQGLSPA